MRFVSDALVRQRIHGTVRLRFWGQALDSAQPATWAVAVRLVSRDGRDERATLLPLTGGDANSLGPDLVLCLAGPFTLSPAEARDGDRIMVELHSRGPARLETSDDRESWVTFSADLLFEDLRTTTLGEQRSSRRIGQCIYCKRVEGRLSREHIVPEGLNGELTLTQASCQRCGNVTSRFERDLLRNAFGAARVTLAMRTKRSHDRPKQLPLLVKRGGREIEIAIPAVEYPAILALPIFAPPAQLTGEPYASGIKLRDVSYVQLSGLPLAELHRRYGYDYTGIQIEYQPVQFARGIAKIAFGFAVLQLGLERIEDRHVVPAILGDASDIGRWVGGHRSPPLSASTGLHSITLKVEAKEIQVFVRLFAQFGAPEYHVVVGRVR